LNLTLESSLEIGASSMASAGKVNDHCCEDRAGDRAGTGMRAQPGEEITEPMNIA
jgi:hypothetical protein